MQLNISLGFRKFLNGFLTGLLFIVVAVTTFFLGIILIPPPSNEPRWEVQTWRDYPEKGERIVIMRNQNFDSRKTHGFEKEVLQTIPKRNIKKVSPIPLLDD